MCQRSLLPEQRVLSPRDTQAGAALAFAGLPRRWRSLGSRAARSGAHGPSRARQPNRACAEPANAAQPTAKGGQIQTSLIAA